MTHFSASVLGLTIRLEGYLVGGCDWVMQVLIDEVLQAVPAYRHILNCSWCNFSGFLHTRFPSCRIRQVDSKRQIKVFPAC
jgi:hypothetical protein